MELSTRARYAVEAIIDLALHNSSSENISLGSISNRVSISMPYLEQLFAKLKKANIVSSIKGSKGGYRLNKPISEISILDIVVAVNESIETRSCKGKNNKEFRCNLDKRKCRSHDLWEGLLQEIKAYLGKVTLENVIKDYTIKSDLSQSITV